MNSYSIEVILNSYKSNLMFLTTPKHSTLHCKFSLTSNESVDDQAPIQKIDTSSSIGTFKKTKNDQHPIRQHTVYVSTPKRYSASKNSQADENALGFGNNRGVIKSRKDMRKYSCNFQSSSKNFVSQHQIQPSRQQIGEIATSAMKNSASSCYGNLSPKNVGTGFKNSGGPPSVAPTMNQIEENQMKKWYKIMEIYGMKNQLNRAYGKRKQKRNEDNRTNRKDKHPIAPSADFYKIISQDRVFQEKWHINLPETFVLQGDSNISMVYTDREKGILKKKTLERQNRERNQYKNQVLNFKDNFLEKVEEQHKQLLINDLKLQQNPSFPLAIIKYTEDRSYEFETDVQTYRNFIERNLKPTRDSIVQRYVLGNNLKAMVFRVFYRKHNPSFYHKPQFEGIRFQNQKPIFRESNAIYPEIHKLTSTLTVSSTRPNTFKHTKINSSKALQKFKGQVLELKRLLEWTERVEIDNLYVDFIVDIFDQPWIINIKLCEINVNSQMYREPKESEISSVGTCRLCGLVAKREQLKRTVSIRLLGEFIAHLKKRTKLSDEDQIDFIHSVNINSKQNKMSNVCKVCYKVIINELELIKTEEKLAKICNISSSESSVQTQEFRQNASNKQFPAQEYKQWRLLLYFEDIKHLNECNSTTGLSSTGGVFRSNFKSIESLSGIPMAQSIVQSGYSQSGTPKDTKFNSGGGCPFVLKYQLSPKISQCFKCDYKSSISTDCASINEVKLHYFYSQTNNIEEFIDNTEVTISLYRTNASSFTCSSFNPKMSSQLKKQSLLKRNSNHKFQYLADSSKSKGSASNRAQTNRIKNFSIGQDIKPVASGSTHVLSSFNLFKSSSFSLKSLMENGQRQTATVLLFFENKKYCELTLKVGLVYDGSYKVSGIPTKKTSNANREIPGNVTKLNNVWFKKDVCNSNPLPKEWMEIFGSKYSYDEADQEGSINVSPQQQDIQKEQLLKKLLEQDENQVEKIMAYGSDSQRSFESGQIFQAE